MSAWTECRECGIPLTDENDNDDEGYCYNHKDDPKPSIPEPKKPCDICGDTSHTEIDCPNLNQRSTPTQPDTKPKTPTEQLLSSKEYLTTPPPKLNAEPEPECLCGLPEGGGIRTDIVCPLHDATSTPLNTDSLDDLLIDYRSHIADLVMGYHDGGVSTEAIKAVDAKALAKISSLIAEARIEELQPLKDSQSWAATTRYINNRISDLKKQLEGGE